MPFIPHSGLTNIYLHLRADEGAALDRVEDLDAGGLGFLDRGEPAAGDLAASAVGARDVDVARVGAAALADVLAAGLALSLASLSVLSPADAALLLGPRGEMITGPDWRGRVDDSQENRALPKREPRHEAWLRNGCVRDWSGTERCDR